MYAEDAVFDVSAVFTDVEPMHGSAAIRRYWDTLRETWDGLRIDPLEGFLLDDGRFVIDQRMWAKGTRSGAEVDQRFAMLYTLRRDDSRVVHAQLLPVSRAGHDGGKDRRVHTKPGEGLLDPAWGTAPLIR